MSGLWEIRDNFRTLRYRRLHQRWSTPWEFHVNLRFFVSFSYTVSYKGSTKCGLKAPNLGKRKESLEKGSFDISEETAVIKIKASRGWIKENGSS